MHLHVIPPHKVQKSPPLNVQSYIGAIYPDWGKVGTHRAASREPWTCRFPFGTPRCRALYSCLFPCLRTSTTCGTPCEACTRRDT
jgi:hypothetical protein